MNEMTLQVAWTNIHDCMRTRSDLTLDQVTILAVSRQLISAHLSGPCGKLTSQSQPIPQQAETT